jgi:pimeloyl-ACP methyl ester carboxylesterase
MNQKVLHSDPTKVKVVGIEIVYDTFGESTAPPMLLVMGLGEQMIAWDEEFCSELAAQGYWVIRYDNRDAGLSTKFDEAGIPNIPALMQAQMQGKMIETPYLLRDMADDAVGLLDAMGVESAHVVGLSMGGMIVQEMAIHHSERVRTMTSIMSSTGNPELPPAKPEAMALLTEPAPTGRLGHIENSVRVARILSGTGFPIDEDRVRKKAGDGFDRGLSPAGMTRQLAAIIGSGSRKDALKSVTVPTLVIHGDADPLVPVEGGIDTADTISGAELLIIKGMGHNLPPVIWPQVVAAIVSHAV